MKKKDKIRELSKELDLLDDMLTSLVELPKEKGIISYDEWENGIKRRVESKPADSLRDISD